MEICGADGCNVFCVEWSGQIRCVLCGVWLDRCGAFCVKCGWADVVCFVWRVFEQM